MYWTARYYSIETSKQHACNAIEKDEEGATPQRLKGKEKKKVTGDGGT